MTDFDSFTRSAAFRKELEAAASSPSSWILLTGETGSGKECVARAIHAATHHRASPFISLDCATMPGDFAEEELFGSVRGKKSLPGVFSTAGEGSVFLRHISRLPVRAQAKLFTVLRTGRIVPLGTESGERLKSRVFISAMPDLDESLREGRLHHGLWRLLKSRVLEVPPLRNHREDVPAICNRTLAAIQLQTRNKYVLSEDALQRLRSYDWPGNIPELKNCISIAVAVAASHTILPCDLPARLQAPKLTSAINSSDPSIVPLAQVEKETIMNALRVLEGNMKRAAQMLGVSKTTLYRKLAEYRIPVTQKSKYRQ